MTATETNPPPSPLGQARADYQVFRGMVIALLMLACAGPLALNVVDPDLWGHVRYAEEWIAEGELPRTATHTFTAEGHPWINHENLAEWLMARGFRTLGVPGMLAAKALLGLSILLLMWLAARRQGVRPIAAWSCFLLVAHSLQAFFPMRPQLLSFLWCAVMLLAIDRAFAGWGNRRSDFRNNRRQGDRPAIDWRWLATLPVLFAVWANSHGGFVAGYVILFTLLVGRAAEVLYRQGREGSRAAAGLAGVAALCGLATLLNPYGLELHAWLLGSLGQARPEITEWGPPLPGNPVFVPFVLLALTAIGSLLLTDRRRDPVKILLLALVGWQAATHLRHVAFFAILCGFWLPPHLQSIAGRLRGQAAKNLSITTLSPGMRFGVAAALSLAILLQSAVVGQRITSFPVYRSSYPVDAIQWMADHRVKGNLVVCFNWAQYAIAALAPDVRVAFDGRFRTCYPQSVIDRHFDFLVGDTWPRNRDPESGTIEGDRTLRVDQPDYVLVDLQYQHATQVMEAAAEETNSEWRLVYQDAVARVYGRREVVDDSALATFIPIDQRPISDEASAAAVAWPALPRRGDVITDQRTPSEVATRDSAPPTQSFNEG